jgi:hypothetical protein
MYLTSLVTDRPRRVFCRQPRDVTDRCHRSARPFSRFMQHIRKDRCQAIGRSAVPAHNRDLDLYAAIALLAANPF